MRDRTYFVYIMASRSHTLYTGHKWRECGGFTARYNCDRLVWFESFREVGDAILREKEIKGWRREKKSASLKQQTPRGLTLQEHGTKPNRPIGNGLSARPPTSTAPSYRHAPAVPDSRSPRLLESSDAN